MNQLNSRLNLIELTRWVWGYARQFPTELVTVLSLMACGVLLNLAKPWPMVLLVDYAIRGTTPPEWLDPILRVFPSADASSKLIALAAAATILIFIMEWLVGSIAQYASITFGQRLTYRVSADVFRHLQKLSLLHHARRPAGDMVRRVTTDCGSVSVIFRDALLPLITAVITIGMMFAILWSINPFLTLLSLLVLPYMALVFRSYSAPMLEKSCAEDESEGRIYSVLEQVFSAMPVVKAFSAEVRNEQVFSMTTTATLSAALSSLSVQLKFKILIGFATAGGSAVLIWHGAQSVLREEISVGSLLLFISYLGAFYAPISAIMYSGSTIKSAGGGANRVMEILSINPEVEDASGAIVLPRVSGRIEFDGVGFSYDEGRPTLEGVSFRAEPGEVIALVGATGAGKSTLVSMIPRFFDPREGRVLIDGYDVREVQLASLRSQIALVLQEPFLFPLSLAENIAYGRPEASAADIEAAARAANAHDFIMRLPEGYATVIGERGATLSGGERQRISIARALLKDAPILILDEPTSALDAGTEALIMDAIRKLIRGRTTFIIAHRLATVQNANRILVLDQGRIIESGTHQELLAKTGQYARFSALQFSNLQVAAANQ